MKKSFFDSCAKELQNMIEQYHLMTGLEFDLLDEQTIRIAGTGIFRSIIYVNENHTYSAIEQAKLDGTPVVIRERGGKICQKCVNNNICTCCSEIVTPLYLDRMFIGSVSVFCYDRELYPKYLKDFVYYRNLAVFLSEQILNKVLACYYQKEVNLQHELLKDLIHHSSDALVLLENRTVSAVNHNAEMLLQRGGFRQNLRKKTAAVLSGSEGGSLRLSSGGQTVHLLGKHLSQDSSYQKGKRMELLMIEPGIITENEYFRQTDSSLSLDAFEGFSPNLIEAKRRAVQLANNTDFFIVSGERGIGKEKWVKAIHNVSNYHKQNLIVYDCGTFTDLAFASQVFSQDTGLFHNHNITICLKEISRLPQWIQKKIVENATLLKQHGIRIIATTIEDLYEMVLTHTFTKELYDLFYPSIVRIPPLRERGQDITYCINMILTYYQNHEKKQVQCEEKAMTLLQSYSWPGNFNQMELVISHLVSICQNGVITLKDVQDLPNFQTENKEYNLKTIEKNTIRQALSLFTGPHGKENAANALGISRASLYRKIQEYGLS